MEIVYRALLLFRGDETVVATSSEDTLNHLESLARKFRDAEKVEVEF
jgi:hypothetical protein